MINDDRPNQRCVTYHIGSLPPIIPTGLVRDLRGVSEGRFWDL